MKFKVFGVGFFLVPSTSISLSPAAGQKGLCVGSRVIRLGIPASRRCRLQSCDARADGLERSAKDELMCRRKRRIGVKALDSDSDSDWSALCRAVPG